MSRARVRVNERTPAMTMAEAIRLKELGGRVHPYFQDRDGRPFVRMVVEVVLCWWCSEYHPPSEVRKCMALPRKTPGTESSESSTSKPLDPGPLKQFSELWEFLTATCYSDGSKRRTGRLSVSFESGALKLSLSDDETGQYACLSGRNLTSLLEDAELRMDDGTMPWRSSKYGPRGKR